MRTGAPVGYLDAMSGMRFLTLAGQILDVELQGEGFSFRLRRWAFGMSTNDRLPSIFKSGLWSTRTVRSPHPKTKKRDFSSASATASASPSTGAHLHSARDRKRLPNSVVFQHSIAVTDRHSGSTCGEAKNRYQSVARTVGRSVSKIWTPFVTSSTMVLLEMSNIEQSLMLVRPCEPAELQEFAERQHDVRHGEGVNDVVDDTEPHTYVCQALGHW